MTQENQIGRYYPTAEPWPESVIKRGEDRLETVVKKSVWDMIEAQWGAKR